MDDHSAPASDLVHDAIRAGRTVSGIAGAVIAIGIFAGGLPLWVAVPAISISVGVAPLFAWIAGRRAVLSLPPHERDEALAQLDRSLKGSARLEAIRGRWLLSRTLIGIVLVVIGCLVILSL